MPCRVGITTNPERRKKEWEAEYPNLRNWKILSKHSSKSAAQKQEDREARQRGCNAHHGGRDAGRGPWYVYTFRY